MPTTEHGIFYPQMLAHTRLWEHFQQTAETADVAVGALMEQVFGIENPLVQWGTIGRTITGNNHVTGNISFARRYGETPSLLISLNYGTSGWAQWLTSANATTTGFTWYLQQRDNNSVALEQGRMGWFAIGPGEAADGGGG